MLETIDIMKKHNKKLIRWEHGFWTYEGVLSEYEDKEKKYPNFWQKGYDEPFSVFAKNMKHAKVTPVWSCDVKTLRALEKRGIVKLDELNKVCILL